MSVVTRFAPSPTGELHLGHAYSARIAWQRARQADGRFLLRIEDIDIRRCKREFEAAILDDLRWLGFDWDGPERRPADAVRRRRAGAQGHADQLSPRRHGRRPPAGRHPGDARRGPAALDARARPAAAPAGLRNAGLRPSPADDRRRGPPLRQARQVVDPPCAARKWSEAGGSLLPHLSNPSPVFGGGAPVTGGGGEG